MSQNQGDKNMTREQFQHYAAGNSDKANAAAGSRSVDAEVGRVSVTRPRWASLECYRKRDGRFGSRVICEEDGGIYGVTVGVQNRFPEVGTYAGWAFADQWQATVFLFVAADLSDPPQAMVSIDLQHERVSVPPSLAKECWVRHGAYVAFHSRRVNERGRLKRIATHVFPLDGKHWLLIARLIKGGRIECPAHHEVVEVFLDCLPGLETLPPGADRDLVGEALLMVAGNDAVPSAIRVLARVECSKLGFSHSLDAGARPPQSPSRQNGVEPPGPGSSGRSSDTRQGHVLDIERVNLTLE